MFAAKFQSFEDISEKMHSVERFGRLRARFDGLSIDGFLVPLADEHQSEYPADSEKRLAWLTGFTGSAGLCVVLREKAMLFVDGRYTVQGPAQTIASIVSVQLISEKPVAEWLNEQAAGLTIGYDARLHTVPEIERLEKALKGVSLVAVTANPIDAIWNNRPAEPVGPVALHPLKYAGVSAEDKIRDVQAALKKDRIDFLLVSDQHAVDWLFNIRGADGPHTPVALGYALVPQDGAATLFLDGRKLKPAVRDALSKICVLAEPGERDERIAKLVRDKTIRIDAATAGMRFKTLIEKAGGRADAGADPIALMKARKNAVECNGARTAHLRDAVAMAKFLSWFEATAPKGKLTEIAAVEALEHFRRETRALKEISFPTISAAGPNAAQPHYRVNTESNLKIGKGIFLIDSGAQYEDGTTDITRTLCVGKPSDEMRDRFTRVLKGMIAISQTVFPKGTTGAQIDSFARVALWQAGLDFNHGTGHGVGSYLSVHEGPQRIAKTGTTPLEAGMMLSNEPGYYKPGHFGIRIENLVLVETRTIEGAELPMLGFETLTFAPIERKLIDKSLLTPSEKDWLNGYHAQVLAKVGPLLDADTRRWLEAACKPV